MLRSRLFCYALIGTGVFASSALAQRLSPNQASDSVVAARQPKLPADSGNLNAALPVVVTIEHFQYNGRRPFTVKVGQPVVWLNRDPMQHTASVSDGDQRFDTGILQPGGQSAPIVLTAET